MTSYCGRCGVPFDEPHCPFCAGPPLARGLAPPSLDDLTALGFGTREITEDRAFGAASTLFEPRLLGDPPAGDAESAGSLGAAARCWLVASGNRFGLSRRHTRFGREGADVNLPDPALSIPHFEVEAVSGAFILRDLQSATGTFLNGREVRSAPLEPGDEIRAGATTLLFRLDSEEQP